MAEKIEINFETSKPTAGKSAHYLDHLANVGLNRRVVTSEDIFNTSGTLIAHKGVAIEHKIARHIAAHKLIQPIENQVHIEGSLNVSSLRTSFEILCTRMDDLKLTHMRHQFNEEFMDALTISRISPGLLQKLTVFLCEYPDYLDQHLFCAWLSGLLAREMGLDARKSARIVVAALVRDLGLLHIDPDILSGNRRLSPAQWRSMQAHTVIGKFIAEETGRLAPDQLVGILEHHERFDGSGYPQAKASSRLQVEGQVIAMADVISSVRFKQFKNTGRGLRDTKAFIQMNAASFHPDVYRAVFSIYKNSHLERASDHTHASVSEFIQHLKARTDGIDAVTKALERVMLYLNNLDGHQEAFKILRFSLQVLQMIKRSGLAGFELKQWLNELDEEPEQDDIAELVEIELMQNELYWQFSHVGRNLETFFSDHADRHDPQVRDLQKYTERTINNTLKGAAYAAIQT